jgi:hypothetical protein
MTRTDDLEDGVCAILFYELFSVKPWARDRC